MKDPRASYLQIGLILGVLVFISTEVLSLLNALSTPLIRGFWGIVLVLSGYLCFKNNGLGHWLAFLKNSWQAMSQSYRFVWSAVIVLYIFPLFFLAIYASPNNTDTLNYHLARVVFWLQNQNIEHFPTPFAQQLYHNVFSEYFLLHIFAASGLNDYFVNLVQFGAMLGSIFAIQLIVKQLGGNYRIQTLASVLQMTLPIGIFESTTAQNDYLACFFFLAFVHFGLKIILSKNKNQLPTNDVVWLSIALAFGCFTKYPIFFFALPVCIWIAVDCLRYRSFMQSTTIFLSAFMCLFVVFTPFFSRNHGLFNNVLGAQLGHSLFVENVSAERHDLPAMASNIIKNVTLNMALPLDSYNRAVETAIDKIHAVLGVNKNDPQLTVETFKIHFTLQEDMAVNPWHFVTIILLGGILFVFTKNKLAKLLYIMAASGFIIFSISIKYQVYNSRIEIPLFAIALVAVATIFDQARWAKYSVTTMLIFLVLGLPNVFGNVNKVLIPFRPMAKYLMGYLPPSICLAYNKNVEAYKAACGHIYDFNGKDWCSSLVTRPNLGERFRVLNKLDSLGYFDGEYQTVLNRSREQNYYVSLYNDLGYNDMLSLAQKIPKNTKTMGLIFPIDMGHYREWAVLKKTLENPVEMRYVVFPKGYEKAPNYIEKFKYQYILTHSLKILKTHIDTTQIDTIYATATLKLVKLKTPTSQRYHATISQLKLTK